MICKCILVLFTALLASSSSWIFAQIPTPSPDNEESTDEGYLLSEISAEPVEAQLEESVKDSNLNNTEQYEEITISASKHWELAAKIINVDASRVEDKSTTHPNEVFAQVPSVWISRGSGQEHLTAIRSPVLTGTGACGNVLFLEQGVSIRPGSFCNINNLFELDLNTADSIEVVLGPAGAVYGGNALNGAINIIREIDAPTAELSVFLQPELRKIDYQQSFEDHEINFSFTDADSFRDDEGYSDFKYNHLFDFQDGLLSLSFTNLDQNTAGYITGTDSYKDESTRNGNVNPEAYRKAQSIRLIGQKEIDNWELLAWVRTSDMEFIQHFIPGAVDPIETNSHYSGGSILQTQLDYAEWDITLGIHTETGLVSLTQTQTYENTCVFGTCYPTGTHFDYSVGFTSLATFGNSNVKLSKTWNMVIDARIQKDDFDYTTNIAAGDSCSAWKQEVNSDFSGTCRYFRPDDSSNSYSNFSWRVGANKALDSFGNESDSLLFFSLSNGFRTPQIAELYRLQYDQTTADLDGEDYLQFEVGMNTFYREMNISWSIWFGEKTNVVYRNSNDFLVDNAKTSHNGLEISFNLPKMNRQSFSLSFSYGDHTYASSEGSVVAGNKIDTAPALGVNGFWQYAIAEKSSFAWELDFTDSYYTNPANTAEYDGHTLIHLYFNHLFADEWSLQVQAKNVTDEYYAERADNAFGNDRYFPGAPLTLGIKFTKQWIADK